MDILEKLLNEDEAIYSFTTTGAYRKMYFIGKKIDNLNFDIAGAIEDTLHRLKDLKCNDDIIFSIMGAYKPTSTEMIELEEFGEYIYVDLDYYIDGLLCNVYAEYFF